MLQIGFLKTWIPEGETETKVYFKPIKNFHYKTLKELFDSIETDLPKHVNEKNQVNIFYTVAHHLEGQRTKKSWQAQEIIPFDLDGIDLERIDEYPPIVAEACGFDLSKTAIVYSGNGCHILVQVPRWKEKDFITEGRLGYKQLYDRIMDACAKANLPITKDTTAWDYARILRCPFTRNEKTKDGEIVIKTARLIQNNLEEQDFKIPHIERAAKGTHLPSGSFPAADKETITNECEFFKWLDSSPSEVHEPHAYAMLSIAGHFGDDFEISRRLWENFSSPSINSKNFEEFQEQALTASGPRTCEGIDQLWGKCSSCPHYKKVTSPILIKGKDFIGTEHMGFSTMTYYNNGNAKGIRRHYEDLRKWYERETDYIHIKGRRSAILEFNGKHYEEVYEGTIKSVAQEKFVPIVEDDKERVQFVNQVKACPSTMRTPEFLRAYQEDKLNLENGVYDFKTNTLLEHDPKYGFTKVVDYKYDPEAKCPNWDAFLKASMSNNQKLIDLIEEMFAFTISGMSYTKLQKYFLLIGKGYNGKSTLISILSSLLGKDNYTAHPLEDLIKHQDARASLAFSLANVVADSSASALKGKDITRLKSWTGNDSVTGRFLYKDNFTFINRAKFIFGFNDMPEIKTTTKGDERRITAIPFNADFSTTHKKYYIDDLENKLKQERSGILNKLKCAYDRLLTNGFTHCPSTDILRDSIKKNADSVYDFLTDHIEYAEGEKVFSHCLYESYTANNEYSALDFKKQPRVFNKEVRNIIATNSQFQRMEFKDIKIDGSVKKGIYNARYIGESPEF